MTVQLLSRGHHTDFEGCSSTWDIDWLRKPALSDTKLNYVKVYKADGMLLRKLNEINEI